MTEEHEGRPMSVGERMLLLSENALALHGASSELLRAIAMLNMGSSQDLHDIAVALKVTGKQMYITIPDGGGVQAIEAGNTAVDFFDGTITTPSADVLTMRTSLKVQEKEHMRSFMIATLYPLDISIDGGGFFSLDAGEKFSMVDFNFKTLYLDSPTPNSIKLIASTTPEMTSFYDKYFSAEMETVVGMLKDDLYDADETVSQTVMLDLAAISRSLVEVFASATIPTTFALEASADGIHWFVAETMPVAMTSWHTGFQNTARYVRLSSAGAGAAGDKVSLVLMASR